MLTRALFLAAGWFIIAFIGLLLFSLREKRQSWLLSFSWLFFVVIASGAWAFFTFGVPREILLFSAIALVVGFGFIVWLRDWNAFGQVLWSSTVLITIIFLAYSFTITAFTPLSPLSFLLAIIFFFVEAIALTLALSHTYESLDATTRIRWRRKVDRLPQVHGYTPKVSLHVPTYNEPPEVVEKTLQALAKLDYPNYEVLVIDNNTPDESTWRAIEEIVERLGPPFRYLHLDQWPGYKSGALNFALSQTAPDAEIIGSIDSDYQVMPTFLRDLVPGFADPNIAFIQTPQDYTGFAGHPYTEATYYGYKYFFEVSMPSRNEHNAIIFAGTMGLIRKSVLQEIGGWDEWCITEDAEASLRILKRGYKSLFINRTYGYGLMPFTFDGLKKQRFRWCFGGIQILRKHWEALMPWARMVDPKNRMSISQRYYYLAGGLQWYTEMLNLVFAFS
jgi:cellulose synthase/poly-beta-1,6-N-acetylglucosamine synthase-like glycosyltransferase